jgi:putative ABC transport system permease protein
MPPGFLLPSDAQLWFPLDMDAKTLMTRGTHWATALGRLKPGVTVQQAQADVSLIASRLEKQYPDSNYKVGAVVMPLHDDLVGSSRTSLLMMFWAVGLVLLIACANVANLLLSRAVARQREMAIRSALGAARGRLVRQLLTESVLLSVIGGVLGLLLAWAAVRSMAGLKEFVIPQFSAIRVDPMVLSFTFTLAVLVGIVFGIVPALQTTRADLHDELKGGAGTSISASRRRRLASNVLVIGEVALSLLLLISAGLLLKNFARLRNLNVGVRPQGVWTATIMLPKAKYPDQEHQYSFAQALLDRARQIGGVDSAALSNRLPLEGGSNSYVKLRGQTTRRESGPLVENHSASADYFRAMGIPLLEGRLFTDEDVAITAAHDARLHPLYDRSEEPPADLTNSIVYPSVINQKMARNFWPNQNPIGQLFSPGGDNGPWQQVIGVVGDVRQWGLTHEPAPEEYSAFAGNDGLFLVLHTSRTPESLTPEVRRILADLDPSLPLFEVRTMDEVIAEHASGQQFLSLLLGSFATLAMLLAAVGIYGVLSYAVTQRTREIGIRLSLGATRGDVIRLVLSQGLRLAFAGFLIGIVAAFSSRRLLAGLLHEIKASDPAIFLLAPLCLAVVAFLACYLPARRASQVDPMVALRTE